MWLATSEQGGQLTGEYVKDEKAAQPSAAALDDGLARELWERSAVLVGLAAATQGSSGSSVPTSTP